MKYAAVLERIDDSFQQVVDISSSPIRRIYLNENG